MPTVLSCPECSAKIRVQQTVTRQKRVKCPRCRVIFVPADADEPPGIAEDELEVVPIPREAVELDTLEVVSIQATPPREARPVEEEIVEVEPDLFQEAPPPAKEKRRPVREADEPPARAGSGRRKSGSSLLTVLLIVGLGGGFLVLLCGGIGGGAYFLGWIPGTNPPPIGPGVDLGVNPNVNLENFDKLKTGMSRADVEAIMGRGLVLANDAVPPEPGLEQGKQLATIGRQQQITTWLRWSNGDHVIHVGLRPDPTGKEVQVIACYRRPDMINGLPGYSYFWTL